MTRTALLNPYRLPAAAARAVHRRAGRVAAVAVAGAAVVTGCSTGGGSDTEVDVPTAIPTMPVPTPAGTPAPSTPAAPSSTPAAPSATPAAPSPAAAATPQAGAPQAPRLQKAGADYTVERGDTLSALAVRFDVPGGWPALFRCNSDVLWNPDLILVGQQLDTDCS